MFYGIYPSLIGLFLLPIFGIITMFSTLGFGLMLSATNVKYRDVRYVIPFIIQIGLFITPVIYPVSITGTKWQFLLWINPITGVIENARAGLLGAGEINIPLLGTSFLISLFCLVIGIIYFRRVEKDFADII